MTIDELFQKERKEKEEETVWRIYSENYFNKEKGIDDQKGESL